MATLTKGKTFSNGELVTPANLHQMVDAATVANIVNADIAAGAAIADTKLAQITTAGKVANSATTATNASTANAMVARDGSGNFSAGTITANLTGNVTGNVTGNASTATILQTARTINGVSFNGSANIIVTATPDAHTHDDRYYTETEMNTLLAGKQASGSYAPATGIAPSAITGTAVITTDSRLSDARTPTTHTHDASNITSGTLSNARTTATSENSANAIVARNGNGDFSAQTINSSVVNTSTLNVTNPSGNAAIEVGGNGYAFIDLKVPNSDDNDLRIGTTGNGGYLETSNNGNIILNPGTGSVGIAIGTPEARLHVVRGANIWGSAQFAGSQETSFFHNGADEHTYIRGGRSASHVYINDVNPNGYTFIGSGGLGIHTAPTHGRKLQINGRVGFQNLPTFANNSTAISGGLTIDDVYKTATGELRVVV
jgi:hypothetical protein